MALKEAIKDFAYKLGADLVGIGDIGRCAHAPLMMSPQGLYPDAQSVIVMAVHHPDACIELGGEKHPQDIGPYTVQYAMNSRLDHLSYRMATFLEQQGFGAVPIAASNIWRYNQYKDLDAIFAPDISNIYMAVVAGLADMGFNGLALTPEYGARNRFVTVVTNAALEPDPLIPPGTVCDNCMLCRKHCPTAALSTEIDGEKVLKIGPYEYRFPNKNLWRCAWGEHFDLEVNLDIPDVVDEQVILDFVAEHGVRSGEMGQCLKFCLPADKRSFDRDYSRTPMRKYSLSPETRIPHRADTDRLVNRAVEGGADRVVVRSREDLLEHGIDLDDYLPGAKSAVTMMVLYDKGREAGAPFYFGANRTIEFLCYDMTRELEKLGARTLMTMRNEPWNPDPSHNANISDQVIATLPELHAEVVYANTIITREPMESAILGEGAVCGTDFGDASVSLTHALKSMARSLGADLAGIASADRVNNLADQLREIYEGAKYFEAWDKSIRFSPYKPKVNELAVHVKDCSDWLQGAQSVFVIGSRYHKTVLRQATKPPAEAVGPYCFDTYASAWENVMIASRVVQRLREFGYRAMMTTDLHAVDSVTASPRGYQPDLFANRFVALAAGLGWLSVSGHLATPEFGLRQRCIAIVTDAPLEADAPIQPEDVGDLCRECEEMCVTTCPSQAFDGQNITIECEGKTYSYRHIDRPRCDWSKRDTITGESGFKYLGSPLDVKPPEQITADAIAEAVKGHDPIKKFRPVVAEPCVLNCPYATK
ncbi:MAG: hypothetical protein ACLFUS_16290 [Candidatus Sumerlaeia bacterium]